MNPQLALSLPAQPVLCINKHTVDSSTSLRSGFSRILNLVLENITLYYTCVLTMFWWDTVQSHEQGARDLNVGNVKATLSSNLLVTAWSFSSLDWTEWQRPDAGLYGWRIPRHRALFPFDSSRVPSAASERGIPARACCADPLARRTTNESKIEANSPPCSAVERADPRAFPPSFIFFSTFLLRLRTESFQTPNCALSVVISKIFLWKHKQGASLPIAFPQHVVLTSLNPNPKSFCWADTPFARIASRAHVLAPPIPARAWQRCLRISRRLDLLAAFLVYLEQLTTFASASLPFIRCCTTHLIQLETLIRGLPPFDRRDPPCPRRNPDHRSLTRPLRPDFWRRTSIGLSVTGPLWSDCASAISSFQPD